MKNLIRSVALVVIIMLPGIAGAQIVYSKGGLTVNDEDRTYWGLYINHWPKMQWTCNDTNFFKLDVSTANPRLAGTGDKIVFYNTDTGTYNSIQVANIYNYSDARAKENVETLADGLNTVLSLRPVSYTWKVAEAAINTADTASLISAGSSDNTELQYGFLAQEVEEVLPEAVKTDDAGNKLVNYVALIPVLVQAVQDLQATVEAQAQKIEQLQSQTGAAASEQSAENKIISCTPDESGTVVTLRTVLSADATDAVAVISDMTGNREKSVALSPAVSNVTENVSALKKGIHVVSLYVSDALCNSVRFIKK